MNRPLPSSSKPPYHVQNGCISMHICLVQTKNSHNVFFTFRIWNVFFTFSAYVFFTFSDRGGVGGCRRFLHVFFTFSLRFLHVFFTYSSRFLHVSFHAAFKVFSASMHSLERFLYVFFTFSSRFLYVFLRFSLRAPSLSLPGLLAFSLRFRWALKRPCKTQRKP